VITNPKLVLIVGSLGLGSNILGLFLFHDHGHGHGNGHGGEVEGENSPGFDPISNAEEGAAQVHDHGEGELNGRLSGVEGHNRRLSWKFTTTDEGNTTASAQTFDTPRKSLSNGDANHPRRHRRTSGSRGLGFGSVNDLPIHPASLRNEIIAASRIDLVSEPEEEAIAAEDDVPTSPPTETSKLMKYSNGSPVKYSLSRRFSLASLSKKKQGHRHDSWHADHHHSKPKDASAEGGHGHSHGDLNMRGIFLHVMGDALGNIGVIASALFIWLTTLKWRYYADPAISLVITVIILSSALPLCKAASRILLQAVPVGISVAEIKDDIEQLPNVTSCHHLHVWQLSDTKLVASLHVQVNCEVHGAGSASYMHLAREIRRCLHDYGIHSSTIQPEFCSASDSAQDSSQTEVGSEAQSPKNSKPGSVQACLLDCDDDCADGKKCCPALGVVKGH